MTMLSYSPVILFYNHLNVIYLFCLYGVLSSNLSVTPSTFNLIIYIMQVQEKRVKRISEMTADHSVAGGTENIPCSGTASSGVSLPNGECSDRPHKFLNNGFNYSLGEFPSLQLPVVIALHSALMHTFSLIALLSSSHCG